MSLLLDHLSCSIDLYVYIFTNTTLSLAVVVQLLSHVWLFAIPWTAAHQPFLYFTSTGVCSNSCPVSWWYLPTISSSVTPFSSCPQSFLASGYFPMSQLFALNGQSIGASASASVLQVNIQGWFPLGLTSWSPCSPRNSQEQNVL